MKPDATHDEDALASEAAALPETTEEAPVPLEPTEGAKLLALILADDDEPEGAPEDASRAAPPEATPAAPERIDGVVVATLEGFDAAGAPLVVVPGAGGARAARALVALNPGDAGRSVAVMFERGDPAQPIVLGCMHVPVPAPGATVGVSLDKKRLALTAEEEIVLQCGKASITLTRAGKIIIRGAYVVTRSSGVNRIVGGTVQIN